MKKAFTYPLFSFCILMLSFFYAHGQLSIKGIPLALDNHKAILLSDPDVKTFPAPDLQLLMMEDQVIDTIFEIPFRFGENIYTSLNPDNSGTWDYLEDGSRVWQLGIKSEGAVSINLAFDRYHLPEGARMYVYTPDGHNILGAFTSLNNQKDGYFATTLLPGDEVIVEYYEPARVDFRGEINLWQITHGYRGPGDFLTKAFGGSGSCNVNVACTAGEGWDNQIRSVGMMITGGNGFCTGTLINNTRHNGTPYFLSANHCYKDPSTLVFWFNWQNETCANPATIPPHDAMSGATEKSRNSTSDFWLLELNQPIPEDYNVYFAGWNRTLESTVEGTFITIHHPRGDIKKISWSTTGIQAASYLSSPGTGTTHWRIGSWEGGSTTERGSSGSALFDSMGRIIGQLHGGYAACGNQESDWFGRFGVSWTGNNTDATRLSNWLDPDNTGTEEISGYDPVLDAADPQAPAAITDLLITVGEEGDLSALISWTNPSLTFEGEPLTELDSVIIYRNGELIQWFTETHPGEEIDYTDTNIDNPGNYLYALRATNASGKGPFVLAGVYIGHDLPATVTNITLAEQNNYGLLTWHAPSKGLNNAYFDPSSITHYRVTRNPDGVVFTVEATETALLDTLIPEMGVYSYTIAAVNHIGEGAPATSNQVLLASQGAVFMFNGAVYTCEGVLYDSGGPNTNYQNSENLTLTLMPEIPGARVNLQFIAFDTEANYDFLYVYDGDEPIGENLIGQFSGAIVPEELSNITSTHPTGAITLRFTSDFSVNRSGWRANISCFIPADDDMSAISIKGNTTPSVGIETIYTVRISNTGFAPQTNYQVLIKSQTNQVLASMHGLPVNPGQTIDLPISWTPASTHEGNMIIRGVVELEGDENPDNNETPTLTVSVLPLGILAITIGTGTDLPAYRIPFDFYWRNSLAQSIYYPDEIIVTKGIITGLSFYNQFESSLTNKQITIYLSHTPKESMTDGFVPVTSDDIVFKGIINFPSGANNIYIPFDQPFQYNGGNLLITTNRVFEQEYHTVNEKFYLTTTTTRPKRTVQLNADSFVINPEDPPTSGSIIYRDTHPNTTLYFETENQPSTYTVNFTVDMTEVPHLLFDPAMDRVYISGSMHDWAEPGTEGENQLLKLQEDLPGHYSLTMDLAPGEYQYKYFINEGFTGAEWPGEPGRSITVTGNMDISDEFALGNWEYADIQFIHISGAAAPIELDIYVNEKLFADNLEFRSSTALQPFPVNHTLAVSIAQAGNKQANDLYAGDLILSKEKQYIAIISGIAFDAGYIPDKPFQLFLLEKEPASLIPNHSNILLFHGSTDAPGIDVVRRESKQQMVSFEYGEWSEVIETIGTDFYMDVIDNQSQQLIHTYLLPLESQNLQNSETVIAATGFLFPESNSNGPEFGLWLATHAGGNMIELANVTAIESIDQTSMVSIYPNPAKGHIRVYSETAFSSISITDINGRTVFHEYVNDHKHEISLPSLLPGVYFVKVLFQSNLSVKKLIVE
jgi:hypothetical protein